MLGFKALLSAIPVVIKAGNVPTIVGEAGIGKSALVAAVAQQMKAKQFTTVVSLLEKGDIAIPVPPLDQTGYVKTTQYGTLADIRFGYFHTLINIIETAEQHPGQPIIWFLDEFNRGSQAVQSELMNLVLQRSVNGLQLPKEVKLVLAENPDATMAGFSQTAYGVTTGDPAINDRTVRLVMRADTEDWLSWAKSQVAGRPRVIEPVTRFIEENPELLAPSQHDDDLYPTPRAWARVAANLKSLATLPISQQLAVRYELLRGDLGETVASIFDLFLQRTQAGLTAEEIYQADSDWPAVVTRFQQFTTDQQQTILLTCLKQEQAYPLTVDQNAHRYLTLLNQLPADGQYAVALAMADRPDLLERLANAQALAPTSYTRTSLQSGWLV